MAASGSDGTTCASCTGSARWARPSSSSEAARLLLALGLLLAVLPPPARGAPGRASERRLDPPASPAAAGADAEALRRRVGVLRRHLTLAKAGHHYLVVDRARMEVRLEMAGAPLRRWSVSGIGSSRPRRLLKESPVPAGWDARAWTGGRLDPARRETRLEVTAPPPGGDPIVPPVPPSAEEAIPVPPAFLVRFEGGLAVEVRTPSARGRGLLRSLGEDLSLLFGGGDRLRIRVEMAPADAAALYRSLPPEIALLLE